MTRLELPELIPLRTASKKTRVPGKRILNELRRRGCEPIEIDGLVRVRADDLQKLLEPSPKLSHESTAQRARDIKDAAEADLGYPQRPSSRDR